MSNTKIVVIKLKQIIMGALFAVIGIILIVLLIALFRSGKDDSSAQDTATYKPGVYKSVIELNESNLELELVVDKDHIKSARIVNLDDSITTMNPLIAPAIEYISNQLSNDVDLSSIEIREESKYTQTLLLEAIEQTLQKALVEP